MYFNVPDIANARDAINDLNTALSFFRLIMPTYFDTIAEPLDYQKNRENIGNTLRAAEDYILSAKAILDSKLSLKEYMPIEERARSIQPNNSRPAPIRDKLSDFGAVFSLSGAVETLTAHKYIKIYLSAPAVPSMHTGGIYPFYACWCLNVATHSMLAIMLPFSSLTLSFNGYQSRVLPRCRSFFRKGIYLFCAR